MIIIPSGFEVIKEAHYDFKKTQNVYIMRDGMGQAVSAPFDDYPVRNRKKSVISRLPRKWKNGNRKDERF